MNRFLRFTAALAGLAAFHGTARAIDVTIDPDHQKQLIANWGFDVKQPGKARIVTPEFAHQLFVDDKMTILRVPIYGNASQPSHPSEGTVDGTYYADVLTAMANARKVKPDVIFFASKRLENIKTFPPWVLGPDGIIPEKYARLIADYLQFMQAHGFPIDYLGPDNETEWNKGNITPEKEAIIERELKSLAQSRGFKMPKLVVPEEFYPDADFLRKATALGNEIDIVGSHYYPDRPFAKLQALVQEAGSRPLWQTELHCGNKKHDDMLETTLAVFFDCTDSGFSGFVWWSYAPGKLMDGLERAITQSTARTRPLEVTDVTGAINPHVQDVDSRVIVRAFRGDGRLNVWAVNGTSSDETYTFHLKSGQLASPAEWTTWKKEGRTNGTLGATNPTSFQQVLPAKSVTEISFPFPDSPASGGQ